MLVTGDAILPVILSIYLFLAVSAALVLVIVSLPRPATAPLLTAAGLIAASLIIVAIAPTNVPLLAGLILGLLCVAVGVVGGDPATRRVLEIATRGRVRETDDGGILVRPDTQGRSDAAEGEPDQTVMRGGTTIGYLERTAAVLAIVAGYPEAIAVVVALKGIGRFSELASAEARERFIIGTLASLLWSCAVGALIRLAIW